MSISKVSYNTESYLVYDINRGLTETDVINYYTDIGYIVSKDYVKYLIGNPTDICYTSSTFGLIVKDIIIPNKVRQVFREFDNGFPDIMLLRNGKISFVEIKLDNDRLRNNQVYFLSALSKVSKVTVAYFYNMSIKDNKDFLSINNYSKEEKQILKQIELFNKLCRSKGNKPLWVVAELHNKWGNKILDKKILRVLSSTINQSKQKIVWFVKNTLTK